MLGANITVLSVYATNKVSLFSETNSETCDTHTHLICGRCQASY